MLAVIASTKDPASMSILSALLKSGRKGLFLKKVDAPLPECNSIEKELPAEVTAILFASKHRSQQNIPAFTLHATGSFPQKSLSCAPAFLIKEGLKKLAEATESKGLGYEATQEATHHGPVLGTPCLFIEIGSTEKEWNDPEAAEAVAETILHLAAYQPGGSLTPSIGIGGPHYAPNFKRLQLSSEHALSHVCPKHELGTLDEAGIRQAMEKTYPAAKSVLVDWKGLGGEKGRISSLLKGMGVDWKKTRDV